MDEPTIGNVIAAKIFRKQRDASPRYRKPLDDADAVENKTAIHLHEKPLAAVVQFPGGKRLPCVRPQDYAGVPDQLPRDPQVMVLTDDIYEHIRFDGQPSPHILAIEPALRDRTVIVNGVSKTYAMTGWRIGYAAGPSDIIAALDMIQSQSTSNASSVSQAAALAALQAEPTFLRGWVEIYKQRRDRGLELLNAIPGLSCRTPGGAFYLYVNCQGLIGKRTPDGKTLASDLDLVLYLLDSEGVAVVAGSSYGSSPYFRISIATAVEIIERGCERIRVAVERLR